jgi:hypothetical protein
LPVFFRLQWAGIALSVGTQMNTGSITQDTRQMNTVPIYKTSHNTRQTKTGKIRAGRKEDKKRLQTWVRQGKTKRTRQHNTRFWKRNSSLSPNPNPNPNLDPDPSNTNPKVYEDIVVISPVQSSRAPMSLNREKG